LGGREGQLYLTEDHHEKAAGRVALLEEHLALGQPALAGAGGDRCQVAGSENREQGQPAQEGLDVEFVLLGGCASHGCAPYHFPGRLLRHLAP